MVTKQQLDEQSIIDLRMIREKYQDVNDEEYYKADIERKELKKQYNKDLLEIDEEQSQ